MIAATTSAGDLAMLREAAREWVGDAGPVEPDPQAARAGVPARWQAIAELGWAGACIPESSGGLGFGPAAVGALLEELGGTLATTPLLSTGLVAAHALADRPELASAIAAGALVVAFAIDEGPHHGAPLSTRAEAEANAWRLTGAKRFVLDAPRADRLLVAAGTGQGGDGTDLFLIDAARARITALDMIDGREIGDVALDGAIAEARLGIGADGIERLCDLARVGLAAEMLGAADGALRATVDYLKLRRQFDRPIGAFQALQHRAARILVEIELARSSVAAAWTAAERGSPDFPALAALAKFVASEAMRRAGNEMIQMHGGIGMTAEHPAGRTLKWARLSENLFGNAAWCADRYAALGGY